MKVTDESDEEFALRCMTIMKGILDDDCDGNGYADRDFCVR